MVKLIDKKILEQYYLNENRSRKEIAEILGVNEHKIKYALKAYKIHKPRYMIISNQSRKKIEKYGTILPETAQAKMRQTKLERYGYEYYTNREKAKKTSLERYGDEYFTNTEKAQETKVNRYGSMYDQSWTAKSKQTRLERYGNENYTNIAKTLKTIKEKYNRDFLCNPEKMKHTKLERYGNKSYVNSEKSSETKRKKQYI